MNIKDTFWLLPFLFFIAGYFSLSLIYQQKKVITPSLIGKPIQEALTLASNNGLNIRILEEREDAELPEGTIISQNPRAFTAAKPNQTLFCMISKQPIIIMPHLIGKNEKHALLELQENGIHGRCYTLETNYPKEYCFAQSPSYQTKMEAKNATLYCSSGKPRPVLFPNLKNKSVPDVIEFLKPYGISSSVIHTSSPNQDHICTDSCIISDQRPQPGTIVMLDNKKPLHVQLQVDYKPDF